MRLAYIGGSFDPPHFGHINLIRRVLDLGFEPIIAVNSNKFIESYKHRPAYMDESERCNYFEDLGYNTIIVNQNMQRYTIEDLCIDVIVVGTDWLRPEILTQLGIDETFLIDNEINFLIVPRTPNVSSSELRK